MPYSFVQIEQEKSKTIQWSMAFLVVLYFLAAVLIVFLVKAYLSGYFLSTSHYGFRPSIWGLLDLPTFGWTFFGAGAAGALHWTAATNGLIDQTLGMMNARPVDPSKDNENVFNNVVEEASVATGGRFKIEPCIIRTSAMNAFALQDFQGRSVIGITEGLLLRLNREQLEAVVAHEAGHVASGDCKETTVTSVIFKVFDNVCDGAFNVLRFSGRGSSRKGGGGVIVIILIVLVVAWLFKFISYLGSMFVSREREYRADALSVRLTRNPKALAEALHIISQRWKGGGIPGQAMDAIFIQSPRLQAIDDQENVFADLFSTHPPVNKRIGMLLDMAHARPEDLDSALKQAQERWQKVAPAPEAPKDGKLEWMVQRDGQWVGPFDQATIRTFDWMTPVTRVKRVGDIVPFQASLAPFLNLSVASRATLTLEKDQCPRCHVPLQAETYEGFPVHRCATCSGVLVKEMDVLNIVGKKEAAFDQRIADLAQLIREQARPLKTNPFDKIYDEKSVVCPSCLDPVKKMHRRFVSAKFPVEVDKCPTCARVWFDKDELEVLQYLYESDRAQPKA